MSRVGAILGIGVDIVETQRIRTSLEKFGESFLRRIFTEAEVAYCGTMQDPAPHYAARFAAKEAVAKAFGTGIGAQMEFQEIEVLRTNTGAPTCKLHGKAGKHAESLGVSQVLLSLSHSEAYAVANAVLLSGATRPTS